MIRMINLYQPDEISLILDPWLLMDYLFWFDTLNFVQSTVQI